MRSMATALTLPYPYDKATSSTTVTGRYLSVFKII